MAYTPGLQIKARTRYRVARSLPISGEILVQLGDRVAAQQIVAQTHQPGDIFPLNLANMLGISAADLPAAMQHQVGDHVRKGELLAISKGIFGYFRQRVESPADSVLESISNVTGQVILRGPPVPVQVNAFVDGEVVEVQDKTGVIVETTAAFLQGIFGIGGEQHGILQVVTSDPHTDLTPEILTPSLKGAVVVAGRRIHGSAVARARELGVTALIAGGIDDQDLKEILGYDLGVAITGSESIGLTIIITEGFGQIAMADRTFKLLKSLQGRPASVNGATQIRAGVLRPEIVVPLENVDGVQDVAARVGGGILEIGAPVRLIRDPWFGELGTVSGLPVEPHELESGSRARVLEVETQSGQHVVVPRANVEIVAE
ncbi:hypothetical protein SH661x_004746 [Planctomicrobium sp. SH661]|uniref:hypothetical protein n=1 Tax=Planctomicrobium sp. SH661 TaxID=3448124 RepID=UPI003F5B5426